MNASFIGQSGVLSMLPSQDGLGLHGCLFLGTVRGTMNTFFMGQSGVL